MTRWNMENKIIEIHKKLTIVDGLSAVYPNEFNKEYIKNVKKGGITAIHVTIPDIECFSLEKAVDELSYWFQRLRALEPYNVKLVTTVKEIRDAKERGDVAIILGSQGVGFIGLDLKRLEFLARLGIKTMQPTYQQRNQFGDGCGEKTDVGLSNLGVQWVKEMNKLNMLISLSHAGYKTSMDVIDISEDPVIFDHSNPKALCNHPRNITDEQIKACTEKGGLIGLCPLAMFVNTEKDPTELDIGDFINHIDHVVELVGVDYVSIGTDLAEEHFQTPEQILEDRRMFPALGYKGSRNVEDEFLKSGRKRLYFYEKHMPWMSSTSEMSIFTEALINRGYSPHETGKILGENLLRVYEKVWGS